MTQEQQQPQKGDWAISIGFYPGILFGMRTYETPTSNQHVIYLPLVDICIETFNGEE
jgi:hypothetical protein